MTENLEIIARAKKGDSEAFRQLLEQHYSMIYRVSYRFTGHVQDAEDVTQEVCMALVDKLSSFKGKSNFTTWLYRVVVNQCRDFHKHRRSSRSRDLAYSEFEKLGAADTREDQKRTAWLYRSIDALDSPLKETALLVVAEELTHAEAAKILDCKEATISWRMHEVRQFLAQAMDSYHA